MRTLGMIIILLFTLTSCSSMPFGSQTTIDWVDFIKWNGKEYNGIYSGVLADEQFIGKKIGTVKFKVADHVNNPNYKTKDGDAAFHEKGTEIFAIKGHSNLIAVKSTHAINGYEVYYSRDDSEYQWHFKDMPIEKVKRIEIYENMSDVKMISELNNPDEVTPFLHILRSSKESSDFQSKTQNSDPTMYDIVLYTDEPIAYKYGVQFDGQTYYWHPWDTAILSDEIRAFFPEN
ncbi:hypothetical protein [Bacillus sp. 03113]|uniref:hypothetical protein n=1 Tax=Bacillus sp. 03113 TaxID=2578211 RepID=UPI001143D551|nr:hypothetical protein [Bacillus sp. 03113]